MAHQDDVTVCEDGDFYALTFTRDMPDGFSKGDLVEAYPGQPIYYYTSSEAERAANIFNEARQDGRFKVVRLD